MSWCLELFVLLWLPRYEDIYHEVMKLGNLGKADIFLFELSTCKLKVPLFYMLPGLQYFTVVLKKGRIHYDFH